MAWLEHYPRDYYKKYEKIDVKNGRNWYEVYRLPKNVYAICEPQHFQEVNIYLIIGEKRALLLDTGEGFCPLKPLIDELYGGEIFAVNSHFHFDHIGSNFLFQPIHIYDDPYAKAVAENGLPKEALGAQLDEEMFQFGYPKTLDPEKFHIPPYTYETLTDGQMIDLGGRSLQVLHTPGHSADSIMLYDEANKILFTGDTFYLGALYAHFDCPEFGRGNIEHYAATMDKLVREIPQDVQLYCSHNDFIAPGSKLRETAEALHTIRAGQVSGEHGVAIGHTYLEEGKAIAEYPCDGFSIVYRKDR